MNGLYYLCVIDVDYKLLLLIVVLHCMIVFLFFVGYSYYRCYCWSLCLNCIIDCYYYVWVLIVHDMCHHVQWLCWLLFLLSVCIVYVCYWVWLVFFCYWFCDCVLLLMLLLNLGIDCLTVVVCLIGIVDVCCWFLVLNCNIIVLLLVDLWLIFIIEFNGDVYDSCLLLMCIVVYYWCLRSFDYCVCYNVTYVLFMFIVLYCWILILVFSIGFCYAW